MMKDEITTGSSRDSSSSIVASGQEKARASSLRVHPSSLLRWMVQLSRFGLAALFLFTAGAKLAIAKAFAANVGELLTASAFSLRWMWPVTVAIIVFEVITAALLLIPRTVRLGALMAALLLLGFAGYALYYVYVLHGEPLECGCFGGIIASQLGVTTALRNLALLIPALIVFFGYGRKPRGTALAAQPDDAIA